MRTTGLVIVMLSVAVVATTQLQSDFCTISGTVTDESGQPVIGVTVEIRPAAVDTSANPNADFSGGEAPPAERFSDPARDREIFAWGETDAKGRYSLRGVPRPGAYILIVRNQPAFQRADAPVSLSSSVGSRFEADLILRPVGGSGVQLSTIQDAIAAARAAEQSGDLKTALKRLQEVAVVLPDSPIPHFHLARVAFASGDPKRAMKEVVKSIDLDPSCADCWALRAEIDRHHGLADEALACAARAVHLSPESVGGNRITGILLYEAKRFDEALPYLESAAARGSDDPNVHLFLANSYVANRRFEKAKAAYTTFLDRYPEASNRQQVETMLKALSDMQ